MSNLDDLNGWPSSINLAQGFSPTLTVVAQNLRDEIDRHGWGAQEELSVK